MADSNQLRIGQIVRLNRTGIGYLTTTDSRASNREFVFPFNKIVKRRAGGFEPYRGESMRELGLTEGSQVEFAETEDGMIESVQVA
jgi:hypothetical protein